MSHEKLWRRIDDDYLIFTGTPEQFEEWRTSWYEEVGVCKSFCCVHDSDSCGIRFACGECSAYHTMRAGAAYDICTSVSCIDCAVKHKCPRGHLPGGEL